MKIVVRAVMCGCLFSGWAAAAPASFDINKDHAAVVFAIDHIGFSKTIGAFRDISGTVSVDDKDIKASRVDVTLKSASIDTNHSARDAELRGAKFLDAAQFPDIRFVSTSVEARGEKQLVIHGELTLHGRTKPVDLETVFNKSAPNPFSQAPTVGFSAKAHIRRGDFGIDTFLPMIGDAIDVVIEVEFSQQPPAPAH